MKIESAVNLDDLRKLARKRLPKIAFDFIQGGVEDENILQRNEHAFRAHRLVPRYLVDVSTRDQTAVLFGRSYASPFGISPTGMADLFRPGGDLMRAEAARQADIPFVLSCTAGASIEELARVAPEHGWFQLDPTRDGRIAEDMIRRAADAGLATLVVTVDVPVSSKRERNLRNGFSHPLKLPLRTRLEALRHPGWLAGYLRHGKPIFANRVAYAGEGADADAVATLFTAQAPATTTWRDMERFRRLWPGNLVVKGLLHAGDAVRAAGLGADGIVVSNHGGRQFDRAPSPLHVLPAMHRAVGDRVTLMLDSGVRRGADVLVALCLGARFVFMGRPTLYGVAAAGTAGATRAIDILRGEIDLALAQVSAPSLRDLGAHRLLGDDGDDRRHNRGP